MTPKTHLWLKEPTQIDNELIVAAIAENHNQQRFNLWFRLPAQHRCALTQSSDPFVVAMIFTVMRKQTDLFVHGQLSPSLLRNLEEFQAAWKCWLPDRYTKIEIDADIVREPSQTRSRDNAVVAFSGGVDSCFTTWRHRKGTCGRLKRNLQAAVMIHGFDIPLEQNNIFNRSAEISRKMLSPLNMTFIPIATNFRNLEDHWTDAHVAGLASCLMLLSNAYSCGLIAASPPYNNISVAPPWGSNPITDPLLSSDTFEIIHDGAAYTRDEKIRQIANWPEALRYLRVCWQGEQKDRNCCRCEKCIRTILSLRAIGLDLPECFDQDITDRQIENVKGLTPQHLFDYKKLLSTAKNAYICDPWVAALEKSIKKNERLLSKHRNFWPRIRKKVALRTRLRQFIVPNFKKHRFSEHAAIVRSAKQ